MSDQKRNTEMADDIIQVMALWGLPRPICRSILNIAAMKVGNMTDKQFKTIAGGLAHRDNPNAGATVAPAPDPHAALYRSRVMHEPENEQ